MRDLVKTELAELEGSVNRIKKYDFFDSSNYEESRNLAEAILHSAYNQEANQAILQARELRNIMNFDVSLKALDLLRNNGVEAKPFCVHTSERDEVFRVKSRDFDFEVRNLEASDQRVPVDFLRNLSYLKQKGIKADVAIATPAKHKSVKNVFEEVMQEEAKRASQAVKAGKEAAGNFGRSFTKIAVGFAEAVSSIPANLLSFRISYPDPVLLAVIGQRQGQRVYLEIGRWM